MAPVFLLVEQTFTALVFIFKLVSPSDSFFCYVELHPTGGSAVRKTTTSQTNCRSFSERDK